MGRGPWGRDHGRDRDRHNGDLADQVRRSVRSVRGNQWMFRMGHPLDQPLRIRPELVARDADGSPPILREQPPVRMIMQVHDELVFEVEEASVESAGPHIRRLMEGAADLQIPLLVDLGVGDNWDEAH